MTKISPFRFQRVAQTSMMPGRLHLCLALACAGVGVPITQAFVVAPATVRDCGALPVGGFHALQRRPVGCRAAVMRAPDLSLFR